MSDPYVQITATGTLSPDTEAAIARITAAHQHLMDRLDEVITEDHQAALIEDQDRDETLAAQRHADYRAYLCSMADHGCFHVALGFDEWVRTVRS